MSRDDTTTRDAALLGGGALLTYFLLRRFGLGGGGGGLGGGGGVATGASSDAAPRPICQLFLRGNMLELDGKASDLATAVAACRTSSGAHIRATGDTRQGALDNLIRALLEAGVSSFGPSERLDDVNRVRATMSVRRS